LAISTSVKNQAQSRNIVGASAYTPIAQTDWGVLGGAAPSLAYNAGAGSLAMSTARCAISWITAQGESLVSTEATVSIAAGTGAFTITQPTVPVNGSPVLGWRVYSSSGGAGTPLLNVAANSTTQAQSNIVTTQGTLLCFPVATTAVQVLIYGAGQAEPTINQSGIQDALPSIAANTTADLLVQVAPFQQWSTKKQVIVRIPDEIAETAGISLIRADCVAPLWVGSNSYSAGAKIVIANGTFQCSVAGTSAAAASVPNFANIVQTGAPRVTTIVDNTATWTFWGRFKLVRLRFMNATGGALIPGINEYDLIQQ
jgi:hypothetical protein